jgi:hypothetical protein
VLSWACHAFSPFSHRGTILSTMRMLQPLLGARAIHTERDDAYAWLHG